MRFLLGLVLLSGIVYGGYLFWQQLTPSRAPSRLSTRSGYETPDLSLQDSSSVLSSLSSVLGASISNGVGVVGQSLNTLTNGQSEPIINQAISNFQAELSKLPEDQVKKIQYNYCKSIVEEYEKTP